MNPLPLPTSKNRLFQDHSSRRLNKSLLQQHSHQFADNDDQIMTRKCNQHAQDLCWAKRSNHDNGAIAMPKFRRSRSLPNELVPDQAGKALFWFRPDSCRGHQHCRAAPTNSRTSTNTRRDDFPRSRRTLISIPEEFHSVPGLEHRPSWEKQEDSWTADLSDVEDGGDLDDGRDDDDYFIKLMDYDDSDDLLGLYFVGGDDEQQESFSKRREE